MIEFFECSNLRCFKKKEFVFSSDFSLLEGENGSGKTTVLEGIYLTLRGRSFLTGKLSNLIKHGENFFRVKTIVEKNTVAVSYLSSVGKKEFLFNEKKERILRVSTEFPLFVFNGKLLNFIRNDTLTLYKFFNIVLTLYDLGFLRAHSEYSRALKEKRVLLTLEGKNDTINAWNTILSERSDILRRKRRDFVKKINNIIDRDISIVYKEHKPCCEEKDLYQKELKEKRILSGCHKDRFFILKKGKDMRFFYSSGQQKNIFFEILTAIGKIFAEKSGRKPVLLLDDFDSELDGTNLSSCLNKVLPNFQIILTTTDRKRYSDFDFNLITLQG